MSSVAVPVLPLARPESAAALRRQLECALADRIPAAFTVHDRTPEMASSGIAAIDELTGGLPRGALTEVCGRTSSGRTTVLLAALAAATQRGEACALVDVNDAFDPESAAAAGVDLRKLLWVRCEGKRQKAKGKNPEKAPRGFTRRNADSRKSPKQRNPDRKLAPPAIDIGIWGYGDLEEMQRIRGSSRPVQDKPLAVGHWPLAVQDHYERHPETHRPVNTPRDEHWIRRRPTANGQWPTAPVFGSAYARLDRALRAADLLLSGGGFGLVAIDLADVPAQAARRVPLVSWFRFRRAVENTPAVLLAITPQPVTQSCASLLMETKQSTLSIQQPAKPLSMDDCRLPMEQTSTSDRLNPQSAILDLQCPVPAHARLLGGFGIAVEVIRAPMRRKPPRSTRAEFAAAAEWAG